VPSRKSSRKTPPDPSTASGRALSLLSRREHSARELSRKLKQRGFEAPTAEAAVQSMSEAGWQSDERFVVGRIGSRVRQGYGPRKIVAELRAAGISSTQIREALTEAAIDWSLEARTLWQRRFSAAPADAAEAQKQFRYLAGRGFETAQIRQLLGAVADETEVDADDAFVED
jgi:regulatory protein